MLKTIKIFIIIGIISILVSFFTPYIIYNNLQEIISNYYTQFQVFEIYIHSIENTTLHLIFEMPLNLISLILNIITHILKGIALIPAMSIVGFLPSIVLYEIIYIIENHKNN